jgi:hypothetical protein
MSRLVRIIPLLALIAVLVGCGAKPVPVTGVVRLDGAPVEGATVTFITADGNLSAAGQTDADGNFSLSTGGQPGAFPGDYQVVVVKTPKVEGGENMSPEDDAYMKHMKKLAAEQAKSGATPSPGDMMKMKMMGKKVAAPSAPTTPVKTELPAVYASTATTPLTAKVPPDNQPVEINLSKK